MISHIWTTDGITTVINGRPYNVAKTDPAYEDVVKLVYNGANEPAILDRLERVSQRIRAACMKLTGTIEYNGGMVYYQGAPLHGYAVDKLVELVQAGKDARPLAKFLEKLQRNPSHQTVENLYQFLEHGRIPLTHDGNFLAYKAIRKDWMDIHSGTIDNSIGQRPRMPRNAVDDRRDVTCSSGLHVCSFQYLPHFANANGHVVVCEVNPEHVVAIPNDYNNTKMRVSEYLVVGEVEGYYQEHRDVLGNMGVWEPKFALYARECDDDEWSLIDEFEDAENAIGEGKRLLRESRDPEELEFWSEVKVMDQENGIRVFRADNN